MGLDEERWGRPGGSGAPGPRPPSYGLIDPADHRLPPAPTLEPEPGLGSAPEAESSAADGAARSAPEAIGRAGGERLDLGVGSAVARSRTRSIVVVLAVLALLTGTGVAAVHVRDAWQTLTQEQLATGISTFRPDVESSEVEVQTAEDLTASDLRSDPTTCVGLIDPATRDARSGATWSTVDVTSADSLELHAVRFDDPAGARRTLAGVRTALAACSRFAILPRDVGDAGFRVVTETRTSGWPAPRDRYHYVLRPDGEESFPAFSVYVRRYGNVVSWSIGEADAGSTGRVRAVDDLVTRLQQLTPA